MNVAYFPFTYLSKPTARLLASLVGPVAVYQPIAKTVSDDLNRLASEGRVEIRTPITHDDDRLRAALAEFGEWARLNPGRSTAGMDFLGARQGNVPFFDDTAIQQIRSDFRRYGHAEQPADKPDDGFSARLFLALAQENDQAVDSLDRDLDRIDAMEKEFLKGFDEAGEAGFRRQAYGGTVWREDPGARLTGQRLRAWARLATADDRLPEVLITTSPAVIDSLLEHARDAAAFEKQNEVCLDIPGDIDVPLLGRVLSGLMDNSLALKADLSEAGFGPDDPDATVRVSLYAAANPSTGTFIDSLAGSPSPQAGGQPAGHTLVVLVEHHRSTQTAA